MSKERIIQYFVCPTKNEEHIRNLITSELVKSGKFDEAVYVQSVYDKEGNEYKAFWANDYIIKYLMDIKKRYREIDFFILERETNYGPVRIGGYIFNKKKTEKEKQAQDFAEEAKAKQENK